MSAKATILVVEDNAITRKLVRVVLEEEGFAVIQAPDAATGIEKATRSRPDLILQDLVLPDMSGFDLVERLRSLPSCADSIILAFTGFVSDVEDRQIANAPFDGLLIKPVAPSRLVATIEDFLAHRSAPRDWATKAPAAAGPETQLTRPSAGLDPAQRAELQASALGVLGTIADALSRRQDVEAALVDVLAQCIDAAGLSRGAVLLLEPSGTYRCLSQIGFDANVGELTQVLAPELLEELRTHSGPLVLTATTAGSSAANELLARTAASSALVAPIWSGPSELGILLLTSATRLLVGEEWRGFARAVAAQLGQAIALRRAFGQIAESEQRYRSLFEGVPVGLIRSTPDGRILEANRALWTMFGYPSHDAFLAINAADFYLDRRERGRIVEQLARENVIRGFPARMRRRDGTTIDAEITATTAYDAAGEIAHFEGSFADVTERRRAEATLRESEERFRQIAENIREVFFISDAATGQCLYVSPAYEQLWGRPCESAYTHPYAWAEAIHPEDQEPIRALFQGGLEPGGSVAVFRVVRPDGSTRWVRSRVFPVRSTGETVQRLVGVCEDITELRKTEEQLIKAQKMEAVGQLAGGIAHDFNNLLAAITVFAELVSDDLPAGDRRRDDLAQIQEAVKRAMGLTRQLLAFSRRQVLQPAVLDPNVVIRDLAKMMGRLIGEDIEMVLELDPGAGFIKVDPGQLEQVLMNLAVNARDAMPSGGRLLFSSSRSGEFVTVRVSDTGTGMTDEVRSRVFEPFFTTKEGKGTGLGLATVYGIVTQSGGHIDVASEPGRGCTFTIRLPAVSGEVAAAPRAAAAELALGTEVVLFVEDEPAVRVAASTVLRRLGYTVLVARNGREALALADQHVGPIQLVLSDIVMPGMDGRELLARIRERRPLTKGLLTSGYAGDAIARSGPLSPDMPFLEKPFTATSLGQKVRAVLDSREGASGTLTVF